MTSTLEGTEHGAPAGPAGADASARLPGFAFPLLVFAASRFLTLAATGVAMLLEPGLRAVDAFSAWDGIWYLTIAEQGYPRSPPLATDAVQESTLGFFPLVGLAARGLAAVTGLPAWISGLLVVSAGGAAAVVGVWRLARHLGDAQLADRAAVVVAFFPGAFTFGFLYTEPLLVAFAAASLLALLRRQWLLAGTVAALASATRATGIVLAACCALEAGRAIAARREWRALVAPAVAPLGMVGFFAFLHHHAGDARAYQLTQQRGWGQRFDVVQPFAVVMRTVRDPLGDVNVVVSAIGTAFIVVCAVLLIRWRPPAVVTLYAAATAALGAFSVNVGTHPRFVLAAFPLLMALAARLRRRAFDAVVTGFVILLPVVVVVTVSTRYLTP